MVCFSRICVAYFKTTPDEKNPFIPKICLAFSGLCGQWQMFECFGISTHLFLSLTHLIATRDFSSLSKDNAYLNNKLVSFFFLTLSSISTLTNHRMHRMQRGRHFLFSTADHLQSLLPLFSALTCRPSRSQRPSWASRRCWTPATWSARSPTTWASSPTSPGTTASSTGSLTVSMMKVPRRANTCFLFFVMNFSFDFSTHNEKH